MSTVVGRIKGLSKTGQKNNILNSQLYLVRFGTESCYQMELWTLKIYHIKKYFVR